MKRYTFIAMFLLCPFLCFCSNQQPGETHEEPTKEIEKTEVISQEPAITTIEGKLSILVTKNEEGNDLKEPSALSSGTLARSKTKKDGTNFSYSDWPTSFGKNSMLHGPVLINDGNVYTLLFSSLETDWSDIENEKGKILFIIGDTYRVSGKITDNSDILVEKIKSIR